MDYEEIELLTPRRRRVLGAVAAVALVLLAVAVALHLFGRWRLDTLRRYQARHGPTDPAAYAPPVAPESENAARALLATARGIRQEHVDLRLLLEARRLRPAGWSSATRAAVERHLSANREPLAALHRAAALPGGGLGLDYGHYNPLGPRPPHELIEAAQLLELEGEAAVVGGEAEAAVAAVATLGRLAAVLHAEPEPLLQEIALHAGGGQLRVLREIVATGGSDADLARLDGALAATGDRTAVARTIRRQTMMLIGEDARRFAQGLGGQAGGVWRPASWLAGELLLAEGLAGKVELARVDQWSYPSLVATVEAGRSRLALGPFEDIHVGLQALALKAEAAAAARRLAELSLALAAAGAASGRYPLGLDHLRHPAYDLDPLTALWPTYDLAPDGSARLALDVAEARAGSERSLTSLPFVWELPPPRPRSSFVP